LGQADAVVKRSPAVRTVATAQARRIGEEILRAQATLGLSARQLALISGVAPSTVRRIHAGDGGVHLHTLCAIAQAVGLQVSLRAFEGRTPSLRDTGQLRIAEAIRQIAHESFKSVLELSAGDHGRSADLVLFGPEEILHFEIERLLLDFQAQYRSGARKREYLDGEHSRPVRLVLAVEDTVRNRAAVHEHLPLLRSALPAGSRDVLRSIRTGSLLGSDGLLWVRTRDLLDLRR
jgi:transcriptional regulator with XRE-family HTH domain